MAFDLHLSMNVEYEPCFAVKKQFFFTPYLWKWKVIIAFDCQKIYWQLLPISKKCTIAAKRRKINRQLVPNPLASWQRIFLARSYGTYHNHILLTSFFVSSSEAIYNTLSMETEGNYSIECQKID